MKKYIDEVTGRNTEKDNKNDPQSLYYSIIYDQKGRIVCKHYLSDRCTHGDVCEYVHQLVPEKMPSCQYEEKCSDIFCIFKHKNSEQLKLGCIDFRRGVEFGNCNCEGKRIRENICLEYLTGFCPKGPNCQKAHPIYTTPIDRAVINKQRVCPCMKCGRYHLVFPDDNDNQNKETKYQCCITKNCLQQNNKDYQQVIEFNKFIASNQKEAIQLFREVVREMQIEQRRLDEQDDAYKKSNDNNKKDKQFQKSQQM